MALGAQLSASALRLGAEETGELFAAQAHACALPRPSDALVIASNTAPMRLTIASLVSRVVVIGPNNGSPSSSARVLFPVLTAPEAYRPRYGLKLAYVQAGQGCQSRPSATGVLMRKCLISEPRYADRAQIIRFTQPAGNSGRRPWAPKPPTTTETGEEQRRPT